MGKPRKGGLTAKQQCFVDEYMVDMNGTQAAIRAGYSARNADKIASELLGKTGVAAAVAAAKAARAKRTEVTADWVIKQLRRNYRRAMEAEVLRDRDGNPTGEYVYDGAVANKALELLGKHVGMFVEKHEIRHEGELAQVVQYKYPDNGRGPAQKK
jgi:phage terminase small subunit